MKKCKKILSVLMALTLFVSLVLPAGVMPAFAAESDDPIVTEVVFSDGVTTWSPSKFWYFGGNSAENAYAITFDYYLPKAVSSLSFDSVSAGMKTVSGTNVMDKTPGHHKFSWTAWSTVNRDANNVSQFVARITGSVGTELYIWNWSVKLNGEEATPMSWTEAGPATYGTVGNTLSNYEWYSYMDDPCVTEVLFPGDSGSTTSFALRPAWYFGGSTADNAYTVKFDYYLPESVSSLSLSAFNGSTTVSGSNVMNKNAGHHSITWTTYSTAGSSSRAGQFIPIIKAPAGTEMYVWNWSVTMPDGSAASRSDFYSEWNTSTNGTSGDPLSTYEWYSYMDDPIVTEITFPSGDGVSTWSPKPAWYFGGQTEEAPFVVSFDYYLPETVSALYLYSVSAGMTTIGDSNVMSAQAGHHHIEWVTYHPANGQLVVAVEAPVSTKMYMWNFSVKVSGVEITPTDRSAEWNGKTNGVVGTYLSAYDWYETMDKPIPQKLEVVSAPTKIEYELGEQLSTEGLVLNYVTNLGTSTVTEGFEVSGFDSEIAGVKTVTVTYMGLTATFTVLVNEPVLIGDGIAYVDVANGNDETAKAGFPKRPFATIAAAVTAIDAEETDSERIVQLAAGTYTETVTPAHTNKITINGVGDATDIAVTEFTINGPTELKNLKILLRAENEIRTNRNELIIGENVTTPYMFICAGNRWTPNNTTVFPVEKVTVNSGTVYQARLGTNNELIAEYNNCYGIEYVQNGGSVYGIYIGRYGAVNFKGNVNITLNVAPGSHSASGIYLHNTDCKFNGNALQLIYNNNSKNANSTQSGEKYPTVEALNAMGGKFYELVVEKNNLGSTLTATEIAGTYTVNNAGMYTAVAYDANGVKKASAQDGVLTVPSEGVYTVKWEVQGDITAYVDSANGDDANAALNSSAAAYKTINAAITALDSVSTDGKHIVKIVGAYAVGDADMINGYVTLAAHNNMIYLEAVDETSELSFAKAKLKGIGGPLTIDLPYRHKDSDQEIYFHGYEVVLGKNATSRNTTYGSVRHGKFVTGRWHQDSPSLNSATHKFTVYNGEFNRFMIGHSDVPNGKTYTVPGAEIVFNGGSAGGVTIGGNPWNTQGAIEYSANINITVNDGTYKSFGFSSSNKATSESLHKFTNGAALQIIFNNGLSYKVDSLPTVDQTASLGGKLFVLKSEAVDGSSLAMTDKAGAYTVNGGKTAIAVNEETGVFYYSENGVLTIDEAGIYKVTYDAEYTLVGEELHILKDVASIDLATLPCAEKENALFIGWSVNGVAAQNGSFEAGQVLTPAYVENFDDNFYCVGSSIRMNNTAIRYIMQVNDQFLANLTAGGVSDADLQFGTVVLPAVMLKGKALELNTTYNYNGNDYVSADVKRLVDFRVVDGEFVQYTAALFNIPTNKYKTDYAVRGYVSFTDINGVERTAYTDLHKDSLYDAADRLNQAAIEDGDPAGDAAAQEIMAAAQEENRPVDTIVCWGDSITQGMGMEYANRYPTKLEALLEGQNFDVVNAGGPGENSLAIIARQGGVEAYLSKEIVFAEGVKKVKFSEVMDDNLQGAICDENGVNMGLSATLGVELSVNDVTINGCEYTILCENGNWYLARENADEVVTLSVGSAIDFASEGVSKSNYCDVYYMGTNDGYGELPTPEGVALLISRVKKAIEYRNDDCYIVVVPHYTNEFDDAFVEAFGDHVVNLREAAIEAGYAPYTNYYGAKLLNTKLTLDGNLPTTEVHLSAEGYTVMANAIYARGQALGYWE